MMGPDDDREEEALLRESIGDDGELSVATTDDDALLLSWAAEVIQRHWRLYRRSRRDAARRKLRSSGEICCACFTAMCAHEATEPEETESATAQLFCGPCKAKLGRGKSFDAVASGLSNPVASSIASPLPKLSLLVQTEAKYQEQLKLLRQQQDLLKQQQQEIELRKTVQAETLALEKQLAKQRRREFKQLMARRQADEARRLQDVLPLTTVPPPSKPLIKPTVAPRSRSVTPSEASNLLEPAQLRRHRIPAATLRSSDSEAVAVRAVELAERAAQAHRRKQKRETLQCYAQDLTPLIHGHKPRKLPLPPPPSVPTGSQHGPMSGQKKSRKKSSQSTGSNTKPSKIVQLTPLHVPSRSTNNQHESQQATTLSPVLRVAIPRQSYETYETYTTLGSTKAAPTPLTAEIKPASWMYELLTHDPVLSHSNVRTSSETEHHASFTASHSKAQLTTLHETSDDGDSDDRHERFDSGTIKASAGQRVTLAPLPVAPPPATVVAAGSYSSERLASLLQKYNVSVSVSHTAQVSPS